jgi:DNA polymerase-3 subunit beta
LLEKLNKYKGIMKFIVSSSSLLKHLQQIAGVINTNTVLPILEDFLFEIEDKKLNIIATDLETVMRVQMDVESKANGRVCIPAKILIDSLKNIADQPLTFNIDKNYAVVIKSDNCKTLFAVSGDDLRPAMTGVFFELSKDGVQFVATDAHRLVRYKRTDTKATQNASFIVPKKPLNLLKNALPDNEDPITVSFNSNHLFVDHGSTQLICRLIDARFPDYKVVIPADNPYRLTVNKHDFQNALRRVNVFSNKSTNQVALSITGNELQMAAQDIDFSFEGNERMSCEYKGEDIQIAFNAKFLIEMLSAADTDDIFIELSTPSKAGLIKPSEQAPGEDLLMLVMPLMLNS